MATLTSTAPTTLAPTVAATLSPTTVATLTSTATATLTPTVTATSTAAATATIGSNLHPTAHFYFYACPDKDPCCDTYAQATNPPTPVVTSNGVCPISNDVTYGYTEKNAIRVGGGDFDGPPVKEPIWITCLDRTEKNLPISAQAPWYLKIPSSMRLQSLD